MPASTRAGLGGPRSVSVVVVLLGIALGARFWMAFSAPPADILNYTGKMAVVSGVVVDDPDIRATSARVTLAVATINTRKASGKILAALPKDTEVEYGDRLTVRGTLEEPQNFETQSGKEFDYQNYLRVRGISATIGRAALISRERDGFSIMGALFSLKHSFERSLERVVPEPQVSLLEGILLGERGGFTQELLQAFVLVGLIHVVVLSGSNISIVAEAVFRALGFLPRTLTYFVGGALMLLFVLMTGGGAASVRALIMAAIALLARYLRRPAAALRALIAAAVLMLLWNPLLLGDSGFVLSVLATFGLIMFAPSIESKLLFVPAWAVFNLRSIVATTLAVELFILPALLYFSGTLSFLSLPVNALVLPFVPLVMLAGFAAGICALLHPALALVPALLVDVLLRLIIWITQSAAALPFSAASVVAFPLWLLLVSYAPLLWAAIVLHARSAPR